MLVTDSARHTYHINHASTHSQVQQLRHLTKYNVSLSRLAPKIQLN